MVSLRAWPFLDPSWSRMASKSPPLSAKSRELKVTSMTGGEPGQSQGKLVQIPSLTRVQGWGGACTKPTPGATVSAAWRLGLGLPLWGLMGMRTREQD